MDGLFRVKGLEDAGVYAFGDVAAFPYKEADGLSLIHISDPRDGLLSRMPSSA